MTVIIKTKDSSLIWLDAVTSFSEDRSGTVTSHPVQSGYTITDHVIRGNIRFSLSAIISNFDFNFGRVIDSIYLDGNVLNLNEVETPVSIALDRPNPLRRLIPESIGAFISSTDLPTVVVDETARKNVKEEVRQELARIFDSAEVVSLLQLEDGRVLGRPAENLVMTALSFPESPDTGDAVEVSISFEKIRIVTLGGVSTIPNVATVGLEKQTSGRAGKGSNANAGKSATTPENMDPKQSESILHSAIGEGSGFRGAVDSAFDAIGGLE